MCTCVCICENACVCACACVYVYMHVYVYVYAKDTTYSCGRNKREPTIRRPFRLLHVKATAGTSALKQVYTKALVYYFFQASHRVTCPSGGNQPQGMRTLLVLPYTTVFLFSLFLLFLLVFSLSFTFSAFGLL